MSTNLMIQETTWTPEQMKLITDVVAKNATPDELKLFMYRCNKMGLDPLKSGQVHFIKYNPNTPGTIVIGIDGFRSIAARTGKMAGIERGVHRDEKGNVIAGWCKVYRSDWAHPAYEEVPFAEYNTGKGPWAKMKETMIKKVAEAATLRMAFPDVLGGVYERAEMDQAENEQHKILPEAPPIGECNAVDLGYRIPFGKFAKRALEEVDPSQLASYIDYLESTAQKKGQQITGQVAEFIERASAHLAAFEMEAAAAAQS